MICNRGILRGATSAVYSFFLAMRVGDLDEIPKVQTTSNWRERQ